MTRRTQDLFASITTEGTLSPPDLLQRITAEDRDLGGLMAADYHLSGERLREAITRSWTRLLAAWRHFETARPALSEGDLGTSIPREHWRLPLISGVRPRASRRLGRIRDRGRAGRRFAPLAPRPDPSGRLQRSISIGTRPGLAGAARASPHGLMRGLLKRRDDFLWGIVANRLRLRVLRDSRALTRQAYAEFDLESMLRGER